MPTTVAVVVAAGRGERARGPGDIPKQYLTLAGATVLAHALRPLVEAPQIHSIQVVIRPEDKEAYEACVGPFTAHLVPPIAGGATRQDSVLAGLEAAAEQRPDRVLIHDAARPFLTLEFIERLLCALDQTPGAIAAQPVTDTLKRSNAEGTIIETVDRADLWHAQTPQAFHFSELLAAHRRAKSEGRNGFTDDAALAEWAGLEVSLVPSPSTNMKLTTPEDLAIAERLLAPLAPFAETRTGTGFDVHAFAPGNHVWLCGVKVAHTHRLEGHSDADVGLHALTDAILGAIGDGDIGEHFPPSDPSWRGVASRVFLEDAARRVADLGGRISNVDVTLLCEAPKISPHRAVMRESISAILGLEAARVGVKATTTEGLGFVGRGEGIAAMAVATVLLPR